MRSCVMAALSPKPSYSPDFARILVAMNLTSITTCASTSIKSLETCANPKTRAVCSVWHWNRVYRRLRISTELCNLPDGQERLKCDYDRINHSLVCVCTSVTLSLSPVSSLAGALLSEHRLLDLPGNGCRQSIIQRRL